jgi:hypothetical protein
MLDLFSPQQVADRYIPEHPNMVCQGWVVTECGWVCSPENIQRYQALYGGELKRSVPAADYVATCGDAERERVYAIIKWRPPKHRWED